MHIARRQTVGAVLETSFLNNHQKLEIENTRYSTITLIIISKVQSKCTLKMIPWISERSAVSGERSEIPHGDSVSKDYCTGRNRLDDFIFCIARIDIQ